MNSILDFPSADAHVTNFDMSEQPSNSFLPFEHECKYNEHHVADDPPGWATNKTAMCAISWPDTEEAEEKLAPCCLDGAPVESSHDCFRFCEVNQATARRFHSCAFDAFGQPSPMISTCNRAAIPPREEPPTAGGVSGVEVVAILLMGLAALLALLFVGYKCCMTRRSVRLPEDDV